MSWTAPAVTRVDEPTDGPERPMLQGWLDWQRQTLLVKCAGLDADQLTRAAAEPSNLTMLGLVRHMAEVERSWFRRRAGGQDIGFIYRTGDELDAAFEVAGADPERDFAVYVEECRRADEAAADLPLEHTFANRHGVTTSLRWVYLHMIEEYARHNGHADLLRERIDGVTGA
jgi:uncharacterized damage-inducible protein DinB